MKKRLFFSFIFLLLLSAVGSRHCRWYFSHPRSSYANAGEFTVSHHRGPARPALLSINGNILSIPIPAMPVPCYSLPFANFRLNYNDTIRPPPACQDHA